jgi:hypothetical protein
LLFEQNGVITHCCHAAHKYAEEIVLQMNYYFERPVSTMIIKYLIIYTGCNRIRYTTLKIYCDQMNSNITTQFLSEHLLTLQIFLQMFSMAATGYAADIHTIF